MIAKIKEHLSNKKDLIVDILNELGAENVNPNINQREVRWGGKGGSKIDIDTLSYISFSHNSKGDIFTFICETKGIKLGEAIRWLANRLGLSYESYKKVEVKPPFGGFWKDFSKVIENDETPPKTYDINKLDEYMKGSYAGWIKENISALTQEKYSIMYDSLSNRVLIPHFSVENELIGVVGRLLDYKEDSKMSKYLSLIPFRKSKNLFGLTNNYKSILASDMMYIFEAEKSTMQLDSYGLDLGVSLGGKVISNQQAKLIKSMHTNCILCLDEGVTKEEIIEECNKLKMNNPFIKTKVGYIYDKDNKYLKKGSKQSPTDLGYDIFLKLVSECLYWVNDAED